MAKRAVMLSLPLTLLVASSLASLSFEWNAPAPCPSAESLGARLGELEGHAAASVTEQRSGWLLRVQVDGATRELTTDTCDEAADATVLIVQLGLKAKSDAKVVQVERVPEVDTPIAKSSPLVFRASLLGGAGLFVWPVPVARLGASVVLQYRRGAATLDVTTSPQPLRFSAGPEGRWTASIQMMLNAQLGGCWLFQWGRATFGPCLHGEVGWVQARGENVSQPRVVSSLVWGGGPGARSYLALTESLELLASGVVRVGQRPSVYFEGFSPVAEAGLVGLDLFVGLGARF